MNRKNNSPHSQTHALNYIYIIMQIDTINNNPGRLSKCMCCNKIALTTTQQFTVFRATLT